jgi:two-component system NarL family response regulator
MAKARILLVDDHELFRQGLVSLINAQPDLQAVGQAGDGLEALTLARDLRPDLIVMDVNMPISNGLEATRLIRRTMPEARIMMLTVRDEDEDLFAAIKAGANGYMLKDSDSATFLEGVRAMLTGEAVLPPKLAARLLDEFARLASQPTPAAAPKPDYGLTEREMEVLRYIADGATDKEIAGRLYLSVYTVKSHVRSILNKLHASNRWQAARQAGEEGLLDD